MGTQRFYTKVPVEPDGRFTMAHLPAGQYDLEVERNKTTLPVHSQRLQGRESIDTGITVTSGRRTDDVEVLASTSASTLSGVVRDGEGRPVVNSYVVLFPTEAAGWATSARIFGARTDANGRYRMGDIPLGRYRAAVSSELSPGDWFNPQVIERLATDAVGIEVNRVTVERDLRTRAAK
jgi:hypothetical protein